MNRYLIHISYIGTPFRSFTKSVVNGEFVTPTIVGVLEQILQVVQPVNPINVRTISRTDAGVHALNSAVVVDLERRNGKPYDPEIFTSVLNSAIQELPYPIRINRIQIVPNTFNQHVNAVKSRTYLYRLGIIRENMQIDARLEEQNRCMFIYSDNFDIQRVQEATQMFVGRHDFRTFMTINNDCHLKPSYSIRTMNYVKMERSQALTVEPFAQAANVQYWDIIFNAQSFLYRQIRRMMGAFVALGKRKINQRDLYEMLTIPSPETFNKRTSVVPAYGLYLANIEFRDKCLTKEVYSRPYEDGS